MMETYFDINCKNISSVQVYDPIPQLSFQKDDIVFRKAIKTEFFSAANRQGIRLFTAYTYVPGSCSFDENSGNVVVDFFIINFLI